MRYISEDYCSEELSGMLIERGYIGAANIYLGKDDINVKQITLQSAMKWLREKYNIHTEVRYFPTPNIYRYVIIHSPITIDNINSHPQYFNTHEEALEAAIKYCLEILI